MTRQELENLIIENINTNDAGLITGLVLQQVLLYLVDYSGELITSTDTDTELTDENVLSSLRVLLEIAKNNETFLEELKEQFLSKINPDTADGHITFNKGLTSKWLSTFEEESIFNKNITLKHGFSSEVFVPGFLGEGLRLSKKEGTTNQWILELQDLIVNGKLTINDLEVRRWSYVGAGYIFSAAGFDVERVEEFDTFYRVYPKDAEENWFKKYDQAVCQSFNKSSSGSTLKRYWMLVQDVAPDNSYIDLSKLDKEPGSTGIPEVGDDIIQLGHRGSDNSRKGAIVISSVGDSGPYFQSLRGIDSFDLSDKTRIFIGEETTFKVNKFEIISGSGFSYRVPVDKGAWEQGTYYYYDRVSHNGSLWLCVAQPSTIEEPSDSSSAWEEQVKKGETKPVLRVEKFNTPGYEFYREGQTYEHTLGIRVFEDEEDITDSINIARFVWMRISENEAGDLVWNELHAHSGPSVDINSTDLAGDTSFIVQFWDASKETLLRTTKF